MSSSSRPWAAASAAFEDFNVNQTTPIDTASAIPVAPSAAKAPNGRRRMLFIGLGLVVIVGLVAYGLYWLLVASHHVSTDDAYVNADIAQVTPLISAPVASVPVEETQTVRRGQVLVTLDPADAKLEVASAEAALGMAERKVRGYLATDQALAGQVSSRAADVLRADAGVTSAQSDFQRAQVELRRRQTLATSGAVSGDELTDALNRFAQAKAALAVAQAAVTQTKAQETAANGERSANGVLFQGASLTENPEVAAARARLDQARLDLARTVIVAPFDGVVARKTVQLGQRVAVGSILMTVVPVQNAYVDANFKEVQLGKVRIGLPATVKADLYGGAVYHGRVVGLAGGTGSAFSLIPAQNATGNWIKIALDPAELRRRPLRVGMSMKVDIDTSATPGS
jgi:membrane fusion protein (multidrug efflux system)